MDPALIDNLEKLKKLIKSKRENEQVQTAAKRKYEGVLESCSKIKK